MGGVKDVPQVFVPRKGKAPFAVVAEGERHPQQGAQGVDAQHMEPTPGELFREKHPDQPVPGQGHEKQPQQV